MYIHKKIWLTHFRRKKTIKLLIQLHLSQKHWVQTKRHRWPSLSNTDHLMYMGRSVRKPTIVTQFSIFSFLHYQKDKSFPVTLIPNFDTKFGNLLAGKSILLSKREHVTPICLSSLTKQDEQFKHNYNFTNK